MGAAHSILMSNVWLGSNEQLNYRTFFGWVLLLTFARAKETELGCRQGLHET